MVVSSLLQSGTSPIGYQKQLVDGHHQVDRPNCQDNPFDALEFAVDTEENQGKGNDTKLPNPKFSSKGFHGRSNKGIELLPAGF